MARRTPQRALAVVTSWIALGVTYTACVASEPPRAPAVPIERADPLALTWVAPGDTAVLEAGDALTLTVATRNPAARVVSFALDGRTIGACDAGRAHNGCHSGALFRWGARINTAGHHTLAVSFTPAAGGAEVRATRELDIAPTGTRHARPAGGHRSADPTRDERLALEGTGRVVQREQLAGEWRDEDRDARSEFGGATWSLTGERVVLAAGEIDGSVSEVAGCYERYRASVDRYSAQLGVSRASLVAALIAQSNCGGPGGSTRAPDHAGCGLMRLSGSQCAAVMADEGLADDACSARMAASDDFAIMVGARQLALVQQWSDTNPPATAAIFGVGALAPSDANAWHLYGPEPDYVDRWVAAYNAFATYRRASPSAAVGASARHRAATFRGINVDPTNPAARAPGIDPVNHVDLEGAHIDRVRMVFKPNAPGATAQTYADYLASVAAQVNTVTFVLTSESVPAVRLADNPCGAQLAALGPVVNRIGETSSDDDENPYHRAACADPAGTHNVTAEAFDPGHPCFRAWRCYVEQRYVPAVAAFAQAIRGALADPELAVKFEVWNEPDDQFTASRDPGDDSCTDARFDRPSPSGSSLPPVAMRYLLARAVPALRPHASQVISAGLDGGAPGCYVRAVAASEFDALPDAAGNPIGPMPGDIAIGAHPYTGWPAACDGAAVCASSNGNVLDWMHQLAHDAGGAPVVITELGWPSPDEGAREAERAYVNALLGSPLAREFEWYLWTWSDAQNGPADPFGLVDTNGAPKPAYFEFQQPPAFMRGECW